jgi:DNA-binding CsgD family transcriptional regulator
MIVSGDLDATLSSLKEGLEIARSIGDYSSKHQGGINLTSALWVRGDLAASAAHARATASEAREVHDLLSEMTGLMSESIVLSFQGDSRHAQIAIGAALEGASEIGEYFEGACYPNLALAHLAAGEIAPAWAACQHALPTIAHPYNATNSNWVARTALAAGELETARQVADVGVSASRGCWLALALTTRAMAKIATKESRSAEDDLREALSIASRIDAPLCVPDALECLAQLACDADSHREAARLLGAAYALRERMGAVRFAAFDDDFNALVSAIRNALDDGDFDTAWAEGVALSTDEAIAYAQRGRGERKRPSSGWDSLTPTELDVVRLVAEGIPNKDIATRLFVSPRTVQSHLRHVYNKLGLTSRVQLAQEAARH